MQPYSAFVVPAGLALFAALVGIVAVIYERGRKAHAQSGHGV
jgi:hypothetical protein